jgi:hypothetical protein
VCETDFRSTRLLADFEDNVGIRPLALVAHGVEVVVDDAPTYFLVLSKLGDPDGAAVSVSVAVFKFAQPVGPALILSRPPRLDVIDGVEDLSWSVVHQESNSKVLLFCHDKRILPVLFRL